MVLVNSRGSDFAIIIFALPTKRTGFAKMAMVFGKSFIYNIKNNGPRIEPWEHCT
jgi:hypothetical protein